MEDVLAEWRPVVDETIEELLPREIDRDYLAEFFGPPAYAYDPSAIQRALADPIWDLLDRGGKRWRAIVCLLLVDAFGDDPEEYLEYAVIPEILHNGTIIVDDVEDGASMRRGEPAIHHEYGVDIALNAGNAMYFLPLKVLTRDPADLDPATRLAAYEMLTHELNRTHLGQGMDIVWHNEAPGRVSEREYLEMSACKTGCLGRIVARLAAIVTDNRDEEQAVANYAQAMSIAFQITDDVLDIETALEAGGGFGKEFGNDVREGKQTLMVMHAANTAPADDVDRLAEILAAPDNSDEEVREAVDVLQRAGSVEHARNRALDLAAEAREHLAGVEFAGDRGEDLAEFTRYVVDRNV